MTNMMNCDLESNEFELQSHFSILPLGKVLNNLIPPGIGLKESLLFSHLGVFGIKLPKMVGIFILV